MAQVLLWLPGLQLAVPVQVITTRTLIRSWNLQREGMQSLFPEVVLHSCELRLPETS